MPKLLHARAPQDTAEEQKVRKLANSRHAPGRLDNARSDDRPQLGWTSHRGYRRRTRVPPSDGARALPSLQRGGTRRAWRSSGRRPQADA